VWGYFAVEIKSLFSLVLLRFEDGSRDAFHDHAFNCISWVLKGHLTEHLVRDEYCDDLVDINEYKPSLLPVLTFRDTRHKVVSHGRTWVLSFRGPWANSWKEIVDGQEILLTHGRKRVDY
jgi:hypothetical protein